jgi:hypothetical protein
VGQRLGKIGASTSAISAAGLACCSSAAYGNAHSVFHVEQHRRIEAAWGSRADSAKAPRTDPFVISANPGPKLAFQAYRFGTSRTPPPGIAAGGDLSQLVVGQASALGDEPPGDRDVEVS